MRSIHKIHVPIVLADSSRHVAAGLVKFNSDRMTAAQSVRAVS